MWLGIRKIGSELSDEGGSEQRKKRASLLVTADFFTGFDKKD